MYCRVGADNGPSCENEVDHLVNIMRLFGFHLIHIPPCIIVHVYVLVFVFLYIDCFNFWWFQTNAKGNQKG